MPTLEDYKQSEYVKLMLIGDSGTGKTGALASLANAGYNLKILDYDNGLQILPRLVEKSKLKNVQYLTLTEKMKSSPLGAVVDGIPVTYQKGIEQLHAWTKGGLSPQDVLVIDSLTFMANACFANILMMAGRPLGQGKPPQIQDYGAAKAALEALLGMLYSTGLGCHVVVNTHINYVGDENIGTKKGYPNVLGQKLSPIVGRYFNTVVLAKLKGKERVIRTETEGLIELKHPAPGVVKPEYPLSTGLADIFKAILS